jgi:uncharacterized protein (TIGR04255 family)
MARRPPDLPDYDQPPVTEVVVGVQFNSIDGFITAHVGRLWDLFSESFQDAEEHPPVLPTFETFGQTAPLLSGLTFGFPPIFGMPRSFFINEDKTQVIQIQKDRFLHNWRKVGDGASYPRFERILSTFRDGLRRFTSFISESRLGVFEPNQCEVTYINQIPVLPDETAFGAMTRLLGTLVANPELKQLGFPEDARVLLRYVIHDPDKRPIGRLLVSAEPAKRITGEDIIQLSLTARGAPTPSDVDGVLAFLRIGRTHIVHGFTAITAPAMHAVWGRKK